MIHNKVFFDRRFSATFLEENEAPINSTGSSYNHPNALTRHSQESRHVKISPQTRYKNKSNFKFLYAYNVITVLI